MLQRITPDRRWPLFNAAPTREIEHAGLAALPPHTLMARAGAAVARIQAALAVPTAAISASTLSPADMLRRGVGARAKAREPTLRWWLFRPVAFVGPLLFTLPVIYLFGRRWVKPVAPNATADPAKPDPKPRVR